MTDEQDYANDIHPRGALLDQIDIRDYYLPAAKSDNKVFPEEFELEMPPVKDQGRVGSCVAHALSIIIAYHNKVQEGTDVEFSAGYIYGNREEKDKNLKGMYVSHALARLSKFGDVTQEQFPYNQEVPTIINTFNKYAFELSPEAIPNRISSYFSINFPQGVKEALMTYGPVVMIANWTGREEVDEDGIVIMDPDYATLASGHCTVIYGWKGDKWLVQNSWGTKWGKEGRCLFPMDSPMLTGYKGVIDEISETLRAQKISDLENKINTLRDELDQKKYILDTLEDLMAEKEHEINEVRKEIENNKAYIEQLEFYKADNEELKIRLDALSKALEDKKAELENLNKDNTQEIEALNREIYNLTVEYEQVQIRLKDSVDSYQRIVDDKSAKIDELLKKYDELNAEYKDLENQSNSYADELEKLQNTNKKLNDKIKSLEEQMLDIEKPYKNWPKWLVNLINMFVNLFHKE